MSHDENGRPHTSSFLDSLPPDVKDDTPIVRRLGQAQRFLERTLTRPMDGADLEHAVVKVSSWYILPYSCYEHLRRWARVHYLESH